MPRFLAGVLALLLVLSLRPTHAQMPRRGGQMGPPDSTMGPGGWRMPGMGMQGWAAMRGMHGRMMQTPLHRLGMAAFALPALADTLGLSDEQRARLQTLQQEMHRGHQTHRQQMQARRQQFQSLFDEDTPPADTVREHLRTMAALWADRRAAVYDAAQQMRQVLTPEQQQMLDGLSPQARWHQMMAHMTVLDLRRMMQMMAGTGGGAWDGARGWGRQSVRGMRGGPWGNRPSNR